jgi:hypothetical protein
MKLKPTLRNFDPKQLVVWNVESESASGERCFRVLYNGSSVGEVFNTAWAGKTMDQVIPPPLRKLAIEAADECAATGRAVYTIISTTDARAAGSTASGCCCRSAAMARGLSRLSARCG